MCYMNKQVLRILEIDFIYFISLVKLGIICKYFMYGLVWFLFTFRNYYNDDMVNG